MRINFVLPVANMSGGAKVVAIYARELVRRGHDVRVVCPPLEQIPISRKVKLWLKGEGWISESVRRKTHLLANGVAWEELDCRRPVTDKDVADADVVIATWWETAEWVNALSPQKGAKVYFIQGHETVLHVPIERCRATYKLPLHKIVVSNWLKEVMKTEYGDCQVDVVPNSVDTEQFFSAVRSKQSRPTIGFLYSSAEIKGVDVALAVIERLRRQRSEIRVLSFGQNRPTRRLPLVRGAEYFVSPSVECIREIYCSSDVWLTASRSEGFNLTAIEAMACRTPVVSTSTGWPAEAIKPRSNGWLAEVDDVEELAKGVDWILSLSDNDWRRLSDNALGTVAGSSWEASTDLFEDALRHACRRASHGEVAGHFRT